jgi:hypothetical protein
MQLNSTFTEWLEKSPDIAKKFAEIMIAWYKHSNTPPPRIPQSGPQEFHAGETHELTTIGISDAELNAMYEKAGEAICKEKTIEYLKGFISGVMMAS